MAGYLVGSHRRQWEKIFTKIDEAEHSAAMLLPLNFDNSRNKECWRLVAAYLLSTRLGKNCRLLTKPNNAWTELWGFEFGVLGRALQALQNAGLLLVGLHSVHQFVIGHNMVSDTFFNNAYWPLIKSISARALTFDTKSVFITEIFPLFAIIPVSGAGSRVGIYECMSAANEILQFISPGVSRCVWQHLRQASCKE